MIIDTKNKTIKLGSPVKCKDLLKELIKLTNELKLEDYYIIAEKHNDKKDECEDDIISVLINYQSMPISNRTHKFFVWDSDLM
jgi:hypothetical protein